MSQGPELVVTLRSAAAVLLTISVVLVAVAGRVAASRRPVYPAAAGAASVAVIVLTFAEAVWFDLTSAVTLSAAAALLVLAGQVRGEVLLARHQAALQRIRQLRANGRR